MRVIGYHGTRKKHQKNIEKHGLDPQKTRYREDHWLGQGVYFFMEFDKALWWAQDQALKHDDTAIVFQSNIIASHNRVLDLRTVEGVNIFYRFATQLMLNKYNTSVDFELDEFRAIFFDSIKEENGLYVIIASFPKVIAGYTEHRTKKELSIQKQIADITGITYTEVQVCVSKKDCIQNTLLVYNEDEEVV